LSPGEHYEQNQWAHEFGHLLGLEHPGHDLPQPPTPNTTPDYEADAPALMGLGNQLRPSYFKKWADLLGTTYFVNHVSLHERIYEWKVEE
jgi:hypothetical protein